MKILNYPERIIYSSNIVPKDLDYFFRLFVEKLLSRKILIRPFKYELKEIGPQEKLKTTFQLLGIGSFNFKFTVRFIINTSKFDLGYEVNMEVIARGIPKEAHDSFEEQYTKKIVPNIIRAYKKAVES